MKLNLLITGKSDFYLVAHSLTLPQSVNTVSGIFSVFSDHLEYKKMDIQ